MREPPELSASDRDALNAERHRFLTAKVQQTFLGYAMAGGDTSAVWLLVATTVGTAMVAGGSSAFNQAIVRVPDRLMRRTRLRPLPDQRRPRPNRWLRRPARPAGCTASSC